MVGNVDSDQKQQYSVGEFSRLCGVPKDTLLYYDRIGLLKPSRNPSNSYRSYSFDQLFEVSFLQQLKATGASLADIKAYESDPSIDRLETIVNESQARLDIKLAQLARAQEALRQSKILVDDYKSHSVDQLFFKEIPERRYAVSNLPFSAADNGSRFPVQLHQLMETCTQAGATFRLLLSEALFPDALAAGDWHASRATLRISSGPHIDEEFLAPAGTYASFNTERTYQQMPETYHQIAHLLKHQGLEPHGPIFQTAVSPLCEPGQAFPMHFTVLVEQ